MCELKSSDIVECVDDKPARVESKVMPVRGQLYTIASLKPVGDGYSVRLKELVPTCHLGGPCACGGCGWDANRFRKVYRPKDELIESLAVRTCEPVGAA